MKEAKPQVKVVLKEKEEPPPTQQEAEARLHQEGYEVFCWMDVPGVVYPRHHHVEDECLWVIDGEISFRVEGKTFLLEAGDRIYLPSDTSHTAEASKAKPVTYLVGRKTDTV